MSTQNASSTITLRSLQKFKENEEKFACLTAYDACFSSILSKAGVEVILVGDSLGMVLQGHDIATAVDPGETILIGAHHEPATLFRLALERMSTHVRHEASTDPHRGGTRIHQNRLQFPSRTHGHRVRGFAFSDPVTSWFGTAEPLIFDTRESRFGTEPLPPPPPFGIATPGSYPRERSQSARRDPPRESPDGTAPPLTRGTTPSSTPGEEDLLPPPRPGAA